MPEIPMIVRDDTNPPKPVIKASAHGDGVVATWIDNTPRYAVPAGDPPWTARDELAKAALSGLLSSPSIDLGSRSEYAHAAYSYADHMLAARKEKP